MRDSDAPEDFATDLTLNGYPPVAFRAHKLPADSLALLTNPGLPRRVVLNERFMIGRIDLDAPRFELRSPLEICNYTQHLENKLCIAAMLDVYEEQDRLLCLCLSSGRVCSVDELRASTWSEPRGIEWIASGVDSFRRLLLAAGSLARSESARSVDHALSVLRAVDPSATRPGEFWARSLSGSL